MWHRHGSEGLRCIQTQLRLHGRRSVHLPVGQLQPVVPVGHTYRHREHELKLRLKLQLRRGTACLHRMIKPLRVFCWPTQVAGFIPELPMKSERESWRGAEWARERESERGREMEREKDVKGATHSYEATVQNRKPKCKLWLISKLINNLI